MFKKSIAVILITFGLFYHSEAQIQNPRNVKYDWKTDTTKHTIGLSELILVLPKGSFPVIDYPKFVGKKEGLKDFYGKEPVISVAIKGRAKAYPLNMLTFHEMANDTLSGVPILPTYCPLCNSGIVFNRRLNFEGKQYTLEFGVSGFLRESNMVMFDRESESWWQQLMGEGIVGKFSGAELEIIPSMIISVYEFFNRYPDGLILSKETGYKEAESRYGINPYVHYDSLSKNPYSRFFNAEDVDPRLPAMERIVDIQDNGHYKVYPFSVLAKKKVINDQFRSKHIVSFYLPGTVSNMDDRLLTNSREVGSVTAFSPLVDGRVLTFKKKGNKFTDEQTGSEWDITGYCVKGKLKGTQLTIEPHSNHFAFAWLAFFPDSEIYQE